VILVVGGTGTLGEEICAATDRTIGFHYQSGYFYRVIKSGNPRSQLIGVTLGTLRIVLGLVDYRVACAMYSL
jgi:hypothetical protein